MNIRDLATQQAELFPELTGTQKKVNRAYVAIQNIFWKGAIMWIKRSEYERLLECEKEKSDLELFNRHVHRQNTDLQFDKAELTKQVKQLAEAISAQTQDCHIGQWCADCVHRGDILLPDHADEFLFGVSFAKIYGERVQYCKKHLHEICPEFERLLINDKS